MKNGQYAISLSADGYSGAGELDLDGTNGTGRDGTYQLDLQLLGEGTNCSGIVSIAIDPKVVHNHAMPPNFSLSMIGNSDGEHFELIGVGPLGLIVTLSGTFIEDLSPDRG
jgi:hypothetical protein